MTLCSKLLEKKSTFSELVYYEQLFVASAHAKMPDKVEAIDTSFSKYLGMCKKSQPFVAKLLLELLVRLTYH